MKFYNKIKKYRDFNYAEYFESISDKDILISLCKEKLSEFDFLNLISPKAKKYLEKIAMKSSKLTLQHFGSVIGLYLPIYISNYCDNECLYCGYKESNDIRRRKLSISEIEIEMKEISKTGIKHILILTGESETYSDIEYIISAVKIARMYFDSVSIEIYPMSEENYTRLSEAGVDGLTVYQETYNEKLYNKLHVKGKKSDYFYRLETPERAAKAKINKVNTGALQGLNKNIYEEMFLSAIHAEFLMNKYIDTEFSVSIPRLNNAKGVEKRDGYFNDTVFVQFMCALRLFMPKIGINISTRENSEFRDNLLGLGVTRMSAGSKTNVGGYAVQEDSEKQFEISDNRDTEEIIAAIEKRGFQAVSKDWECLL